MMIVYCITKC